MKYPHHQDKSKYSVKALFKIKLKPDSRSESSIKSSLTKKQLKLCSIHLARETIHLIKHIEVIMKKELLLC
jgi:hypothetical protein